MSKLGITEVSYDESRSRIVLVRVREFSEKGQLKETTTHSRQTVVEGIENGHTFVTLTEKPAEPGKPTTLNEGPDVIVVEIGGEKFIKTIRNETEDDNLGELPEF